MPMRMRTLLVFACMLVGLAGMTTSASGRDDPCHAARTCPSDDHSYTWSGMSCTSSENARLPEDQIPVVVAGQQYWCHVVVDLGMTGGSGTKDSSCPSGRWRLTTLTDTQADRVGGRIVATSVAGLERLSRPTPLAERRTSPERRIYRVRARLLATQTGQGGEIELILADLRTGATIIAGLPATRCTGAAPATLRTSLEAARAVFVERCGGVTGATQRRLKAVVTVTGVGFFAPRGATRVARNGFGLRPLLGFSVGSCS